MIELFPDSVQTVLNYNLLPVWVPSDTYPTLPLHRLLATLCWVLFWQWFYQSVCKSWLNLDHRKCIRCTSLLHAVISTIGATYLMTMVQPLWKLPESYCQEIDGAERWFVITYGFFIWDALKMIESEFSYDFFAHVSICLIIYSIGMFSPMAHRAILVTTLYEWSTIFLHSYALLHYYHWPKLAMITRLLFALLFFCVRICIGTYLTIEGWSVCVFEIWNVDVSCASKNIQYFVLLFNGLFHGLNLFWFKRILDKVYSQLFENEQSMFATMEQGTQDEFDAIREAQRKQFFQQNKQRNRKEE